MFIKNNLFIYLLNYLKLFYFLKLKNKKVIHTFFEKSIALKFFM